MTSITIVDAGPLLAYLNRADAHHGWASAQFSRLKSPLVTCDAVISEVCFLLASRGDDLAIVLDMVARGAVRSEFSLAAEIESVRRLMRRYANIGPSLADICLVRMSELHANSKVFTTDSDFLIYRREGRRVIPLIAPFDA
ncbi:MAG TPA: PIN domain-containing protein [Vitreimonas sp.]|uniref:type II toxin-antitoxin system VapC family toxin n=1 Tax=Vitreimonas sp. TaxID=3069702 RepID=UPI002D587D3F|nr:PIN domain-containing protein [Vitreimonas sp.]HYD88413.1 PIN domain-containing protein [Vitreimonas sp.]